MQRKYTITDAAKLVGVSPKTLSRWEKQGKIDSVKRDWRGWRIYFEEDIDNILKFMNTYTQHAK